MTTPVPHPRYCIAGTLGRCRVLSYWKNGYFFVLSRRDERYLRHRDRLTFLPD